jgi:hypothetical protein
MKKKIFAVMLVFVMALVFAACNVTDSAQDEQITDSGESETSDAVSLPDDADPQEESTASDVNDTPDEPPVPQSASEPVENSTFEQTVSEPVENPTDGFTSSAAS